MKTGIKKTIAFALTLCALSAGTIAPNAGKLSLSPTPIVAEAAVTSGDYTFTQRSTDKATLTSYRGKSPNITLPSTIKINGVVCKITGVDSEAFRNNQYIKSVTIPEGYTSIGNCAFQYCSNLASVSVPNSLVAINSSAFMGTAISSFTVPKNVKLLGGWAFSSCTKLKTVKLNTNLLTTMPEGLVANSTALTSVNIPSTIKKIGNSFAIGCTSLKSITIPSGVTTLENSAFMNCTSLSSVSIPSTLVNFGENAFYNTPWLKNHAKTNLLVIHNNIVIDGSSAVRNVNIPSTVKGIADSAFANNRAIQQVTIPSSVTNIGISAFSGCTNLATVNLSSGLKAIPMNCFYGCKYLRTINFPDTIENIGAYAFYNCTDLRTFRFPNKLKSIDQAAFRECKMLGEISNVNVNANYTIDGLAFENCLNLKKINGTTVVSRSGYNVTFAKADILNKYFTATDNIGFIQDYVDKKSSAVVEQIKAKYPNYNSVQLARSLENWMCQNGCSPFDDWEKKNGNKNYPSDLESRKVYHREYSVLLNGVGVCEGFAKGYNLLLQKAGIWSEIVGNTDHAWNVIYENGKWFNVDSYWDDNGSSSEYKWFMVSDNEATKMDTSGAHIKRNVFRKDNNYALQYEVIACTTPMGDVNINGKLDNQDVQWLQYYINNKKDPDKWFNHVCADMNFDGKITSTDLTLLKKKINKK